LKKNKSCLFKSNPTLTKSKQQNSHHIVKTLIIRLKIENQGYFY